MPLNSAFSRANRTHPCSSLPTRRQLTLAAVSFIPSTPNPTRLSPLPARHVQGRHTRCTPDAQAFSRCASVAHPLCTPCTRPGVPRPRRTRGVGEPAIFGHGLGKRGLAFANPDVAAFAVLAEAASATLPPPNDALFASPGRKPARVLSRRRALWPARCPERRCVARYPPAPTDRAALRKPRNLQHLRRISRMWPAAGAVGKTGPGQRLK